MGSSFVLFGVSMETTQRQFRSGKSGYTQKHPYPWENGSYPWVKGLSVTTTFVYLSAGCLFVYSSAGRLFVYSSVGSFVCLLVCWFV